MADQVIIDDQFIAEGIHVFNAYLQRRFGEAAAPDWAECGDAMQARGLQLVRGYRTGSVTPRQAHERWCTAMKADGWVWGPRKDPGAAPPTHPNLMDWPELPRLQRLKDEMSYMITVGLLTVAQP
jgi:hypothetical protein